VAVDGRPALKKKAVSPAPDQKDLKSELFKSSLNLSKEVYQRSEPVFFPPDAFGNVFNSDGNEDQLDLKSATHWDIATRYHDFKDKRISQNLVRQLRALSAQAILDRAKAVLGSVVHPSHRQSSPWPELPAQAMEVDFDLEETLDLSPLALKDALRQGSARFPLTEQDLCMSYKMRRQQPLVLSVDTSLSMTGEKLALTAVAIAVVLLEFPEDPIGIVAFENEAKILKHPNEKISIPLLVERFLDVPAQGYTHLEDGMKAALRLIRDVQKMGKGKVPSAVLLTDGKYTAGKDPAYLAHCFPHLVVIKMGHEVSSFELCLEMAKSGNGALREVQDLSSLPKIMYGVVKDLIRGRRL
jgi:Mg-chelatase subunit ChlD